MDKIKHVMCLAPVVVILLLHTTLMHAQWDGTTDANWAADYEEGTTQTFTITTEAELAQLSVMVNSGKTFENATITLTAPLDLNNEEWTPIGFLAKNSFKGVFDGKGYAVKGLKIDQTNSEMAVGLFGYLQGTIRNISVAGSITFTAMDDANTGGIVGYMNDAESLVENSSNYVDIQAGGGSLARVGGIAGMLSSGTIRNCFNAGSVKCTSSSMGDYSGGIVGDTGASCSILNCYNTGNVYENSIDGSLVGRVGAETKLENSYWLAGTHSVLVKETSYGLGIVSGCGKFDATGGTLTLDGEGELLEENLMDALNAWVDSHSDIETLMNWSVDSNGVLNLVEKKSTEVTTTEDIVDPHDNQISLREALFTYASPGDTITFRDGLGSVMLNDKLSIPATMQVTICGNGEDKTILDGSNIPSEAFNSLFYIKKGASIHIENLTIENCKSYYTGAGAALYTYSDGLVVKQVTFRDNESYQGGAVKNEGCSPTYIQVTFDNNKSTVDGLPATYNDGGAMYNTYSSPLVINCKFINNEAGRYGGAIYNFQQSNTIGTSGTYINCFFSGNKAKYSANFDHTSSSTENGIEAPKFYNCTFAKDNTSSDYPDGNLLYFSYSQTSKDTEPLFVNCLFEKADGVEMIIIEREEGSLSLDDIIFKNCLTNAVSLGANTKSTDNLTGITDLGVDTDYSLKKESPALNAGNNPLYPFGIIDPDQDIDLAGLPRQIGSTIDIGAYEYQTAFDPGTITGTQTLKPSEEFTFTSDGETGGTWSSSNPAVASVDPSTGKVKALTFGRTVISYTLYGETTTYVLTVQTISPAPVFRTVSIPSVEGATINPKPGEYEIEIGTVLALSVILSEEYDLSDVYLLINDKDTIFPERKTEAPDGISHLFYILVNKDLNIKVLGIEKNEPTGNLDVTDESIKVYTIPGHVVIESSEEHGVRNGIHIYSVSGMLVYRESLSVGTHTVPLAKGTYIVIAGDTIIKVVV